MISIFKRISNRCGLLQHPPRFQIHGYHGIVSHYLQNVSPDQIIHDRRRPLKRTKLICTIGPSSDNPTTAGQLIDDGMNVCRMNFSHGDHAQHLNQMNAVQEALKSRPTMACGFLLDTKGPEVRTGNNEGGKPVFLQKGQLLEITTDYNFLGNNKRIACSYYNLPNATEIGRKILIADGTVQGVVKSIEKGIVTVEILSDGKVGQKKNMCLPGSPITLPTITETDIVDVMDFALKYQCDQIAVSFTRRGKDLIDLRQMLINADPVHGRMIQLIAKIENHQGIENLDDIIAAADGIMVARGDLGMEVPLEKVVLCQKYIIDKTIKAGKYVVNATQMLDSMEKRTRPTRAEVADVTNSVYDLVDATMLSGESASGKFPLESVSYMKRICQETEYTTDYKALFEQRKKLVKDYYAIGAIGLSFSTRCSLIFLQIRNNYQIVQRLSALRPRAHICVFTDNPKVARGLTLNFGVYCFPTIKSATKKKMLEEFLVVYGRTFAEDKRSPEMALFLGIDETRGYINAQEVVHV